MRYGILLFVKAGYHFHSKYACNSAAMIPQVLSEYRNKQHITKKPSSNIIG